MTLDELALVAQVLGVVLVVPTVLYLAVQIRQNTKQMRDGTYADMVSSGQLGLIADTDLRDRATLYYTSSWGIDLSSIIPECRMAVRRIIPPDIHAHLLVCHEVEPPHRHILTDCPGPISEIDLVALANSLIADERLRRDLVYAPSVMNTSTYIVDGVILLCTAGGATAWTRIRSELPPPYVADLDRLAGPYADEYAVSCSSSDGLEQS